MNCVHQWVWLARNQCKRDLLSMVTLHTDIYDRFMLLMATGLYIKPKIDCHKPTTNTQNILEQVPDRLFLNSITSKIFAQDEWVKRARTYRHRRNLQVVFYLCLCFSLVLLAGNTKLEYNTNKSVRKIVSIASKEKPKPTFKCKCMSVAIIANVGIGSQFSGKNDFLIYFRWVSVDERRKQNRM